MTHSARSTSACGLRIFASRPAGETNTPELGTSEEPKTSMSLLRYFLGLALLLGVLLGRHLGTSKRRIVF